MAKTFEEAVVLTDNNERKQEIINRLNEYDDQELIHICRDALGYDGSFDFVDVFEPDQLDYYFTGTMEDLFRAIVYGDVEANADYLRYNAYMNLESVYEFDLEAEARININEIADWLLDNWNETYSLYEEDEQLFDTWFDLDQCDDEKERAEMLADILGEE